MKTRRLALLLPFALLLGCGTDEPARKTAPVKVELAPDAPFPPQGPIELRYAPPPAEGTLYQLQIKYEGRTEIQDEGPIGRDPEYLDEQMQMELDYRQVPVATPTAGDFAASLVLDALRRRVIRIPPGGERGLEVGDDRIRTLTDDKIDIDLRGAQPKGDLTPRALLNRPFALLVSDAQGNPKGVTLRGIPSARRMLGSLPIRESVAWVQLALPEQPVSPGATWTAKRFFANPVGRLGVGVDVEYRLVGFEKVDGVPCARVSLRAKRDEDKAASEFGFSFDKLRFELEGDAWIALASHELQMLRLEDIAAVSYRRTTGANPAAVRMRYSGRTSLQRLDVATTSKLPWADGTKRFADVNSTGKMLKSGSKK
ncbi:MAG: hypothetical protein WEF50_14210 [Myxococcota bacterium]